MSDIAPETPDDIPVLCSFGEDAAPGAGCIRMAGHINAHYVVPGDTDDLDEDWA